MRDEPIMVASEPKVSECIKSASACTDAEIDDFERVVMEGGQVTPIRLRSRIRSAKLLGFHYEGRNLVAVAALKTPANSYRNSIFQNAGVAHECEHYHVELGWAVTLKEWQGRGICTELTKALIREFQHKNLFATTSTANIAMRQLLTGCGFQLIGNAFASKRTNPALELWVLRRE
jgi:hypothetical protein